MKSQSSDDKMFKCKSVDTKVYFNMMLKERKLNFLGSLPNNVPPPLLGTNVSPSFGSVTLGVPYAND